MKKLLIFTVILLMLCPLFACGKNSAQSEKAGNAQIPDDFSFSLVFGTYGNSSYDSKSGKLIKTTHATTPADYVTEYHPDSDELKAIYEAISSIDINEYPDEYNPFTSKKSKPSMDLVLTVRMNGKEKTVECRAICIDFSSEDEKGQEFLLVCKKIIDIIQSSDEWKALPDYEFYYQ